MPVLENEVSLALGRLIVSYEIASVENVLLQTRITGWNKKDICCALNAAQVVGCMAVLECDTKGYFLTVTSDGTVEKQQYMEAFSALLGKAKKTASSNGHR